MSKVLTILHKIVPATRSIKNGFHLTVDAILESLKVAELEVPLIRIPNFDFQNSDDDQIAEEIFSDHWAFHRGHLVVHTPACSRYHLSDFECPARDLREFIKSYQREMLFDGDVIFIAPESKTLTLFHHEGAFAHIALQP